MKKISLFTFSLVIILFTTAACSAMSPTNMEADFSQAPSSGARLGASEEVPQEAPAVKSEFAADLPQAERIVIKDAELTIYVANPPDSMDRISRMAEEMGGYVVNANLYQTRLSSGSEVPRASIMIRVPAERLNEALERIKEETDQPVVNENVSSQDVTQEYTDLQSRLRNLEAAEAQLMEIMADANRTEDVLSVYNRLTDVREQIEVIKGQIQYYEQSAALSSIRVELMPNEALQPLSIGGWQPVGVARDALQALIRTLQFLVTAAIYIVLLVVPVLAIIVIPIYLIVRGLLNWRRRRKAKAAEPASSSD